MNAELLSRLTELTETGKINKALAKGQDGVDEITRQALDEGIAPDVVLEALVKGMSAIGEKFADAISQHPGCVVGLSALLTTTMSNMETVLKALREKYPTQKIIIGGAPVSQSFADTIGANGYSSNPQGAVELLNKLIA